MVLMTFIKILKESVNWNLLPINVAGKKLTFQQDQMMGKIWKINILFADNCNKNVEIKKTPIFRDRNQKEREKLAFSKNDII